MLYSLYKIIACTTLIIFHTNALTNERRQDLYVGEALSQRAPQRETPGKKTFSSKSSGFLRKETGKDDWKTNIMKLCPKGKSLHSDEKKQNKIYQYVEKTAV